MYQDDVTTVSTQTVVISNVPVEKDFRLARTAL